MGGCETRRYTHAGWLSLSYWVFTRLTQGEDEGEVQNLSAWVLKGKGSLEESPLFDAQGEVEVRGCKFTQ